MLLGPRAGSIDNICQTSPSHSICSAHLKEASLALHSSTEVDSSSLCPLFHMHEAAAFFPDPMFTARVACTGEVEYRNLSEKELALCTRAAMPAGLKLKEADVDLVESLHKKGLLYLEVPIRPDDHVSIPPLEVTLPCT